MMKILILAGGEGTRLWPISRQANPKQLKTFFHNQTLLEQTFRRVRKGFGAEDIFVSTLAKYSAMVRQILPTVPKENFFIEPVRRDRGPAIGLAASIIQKRHPGTILATAWADNFIPNATSYLQALHAAGKIIRSHPASTVMIGIRPRYAAKALGYIAQGRRLGKVGKFAYFVSEKFVEKPTAKTAQRLIKKGYLWNPGIFVWQVEHLLTLYKKFSPKNFALLQRIAAAADRPQALPQAIKKLYPLLRAEEIENAVLEKGGTKIVVPVNLAWSDIGTYQSLKEALGRPKDNLIHGLTKTQNTTDSLIYEADAKKLIVTLGLHGLVIVDTKDALLVAQKSATGDLKTFLKTFRHHRQLKKFL